MQDLLKLARIQIIVLILFVFFKFIRPTVLQNEPNEYFKLFLLSFPNLCEGVIGVLTGTYLGLYLNKYFKIRNTLIYIIAIIFSSVYVITQEVKIHNLGGNNTYDPNDVLFSIIGILIGSIIIFFLKPKIHE